MTCSAHRHPTTQSSNIGRATTRFFIKTSRNGPKGQTYEVRLGSPEGEVIIDQTLFPFFDSCRVLLARGLTGNAEMWGPSKTHCRMTGDIERCAKFTVEESKHQPLRFKSWKPFSKAAANARRAFESEFIHFDGDVR